ncbi:THUMP-like domain-containing protein [Flavobacterium microcysteis]|uniref:Class I SAM-dependent methyltransferase n=1 Tax=Flavobacterium microcysteis TaxID=2596891 RepID=A0A501QDU6_9FLAO|nr:RsmD family RNA methyltransferase [Flavobacterium microcysteis]TPD70618.1 class I SAM-dependent methyltransferase [Flavobacterium microcysteis]
MISAILKPEIQDFIEANIRKDISKLAFQKNPFPEIDFAVLLNQIAAKSKAEQKLPTWYATKNIVYPTKLSIEQTSSEETASYKAEIVSGKSLIDLTGGFGVDCYYFSKKMESVVHCEMNAELSEIASHNFKLLDAENIECFAGDSSEILQKLNRKFDWMYIDPSRRSDAKGKVFLLKDCLPNVPELQEFYFEYSNNLLIKTAPILDIAAGLTELTNVKAIHIVAVENEVKELLWEISKEYTGNTKIITLNTTKDKTEKLDFVLGENDGAFYGLPKKYLYEPNSSIMKSGFFETVSAVFQLDKLHLHSHLYTSDDLLDFPGRVFQIEEVIKYGKAEMKQSLQNKKANITVRNFPETVENIRKKWKISDGGNLYCFFTTNMNNDKIVLLCNKIKTQE